jgi:hypothetical protein
VIRILSPAHPAGPPLEDVLTDLIHQVRQRKASEPNSRVLARLEEARLAERHRTAAAA